MISDCPLNPIFSRRSAWLINFSLLNKLFPDVAGICNCPLASSHNTTTPLTEFIKCLASSTAICAMATGLMAWASLSEKLNTIFTSWYNTNTSLPNFFEKDLANSMFIAALILLLLSLKLPQGQTAWSYKHQHPPHFPSACPVPGLLQLAKQ